MTKYRKAFAPSPTGQIKLEELLWQKEQTLVKINEVLTKYRKIIEVKDENTD